MTATTTSAAAAEFARRRQSPLQKVQHQLHGRPWLSPLFLLLVAFVAFFIATPTFLTANSMGILLQQSAVVAALAVGQTVIILTAGIDLSIGMAMVLASLVMVKLNHDHGVPGFLALLIGLVVAVLTGLLNGFLVTRMNLPPFIVTLGTFSIFTAVSLLYAAGQTIALGPDALLVWTGKTLSVGSVSITWGVILMLLLYAMASFALRNTAWGRHLYATGDDREASELSGIDTKRVLLSAYVVAGATVGIAAWIVCGRVGGADPNAGLNYNLQSITAVVIGGTSLFGGRGSAFSAVLGTLVIAAIASGLTLLNLDSSYRFIITGLVLAVAVAIDSVARKSRASHGRA